MTSQKRTIN